MRSKHLLEIVPAKFQVNAAISAGANPKKVGKMLFLQHFTVLEKKFSILIIFCLHGVKEGHFLISKPVAIMVEHFFLPIKASPIEWKDQTQEAAKSNETLTENPDLYRNHALLTLMS